MPLFGGLFGQSKAAGLPANLDRIEAAVRNRVGLRLAPPTPDVLAVLQTITPRELSQFDNLQSVSGMQELFRAKSIHAHVDAAAKIVTLTCGAAATIEQEVKAEHAQKSVVHVGERHASIHIVPRPDPVASTGPAPAEGAAPAPAAQPLAPLPASLEHVEGFERLTEQLVDLFVRYGKLTTGDKDVLRNIKPVDGSPTARLVALERWQAEMMRRVRGFTVPRPAQRFIVGGADAAPTETPEEALARRLEVLIAWAGKLIKAFEHTGVRYHNKPIWLK